MDLPGKPTQSQAEELMSIAAHDLRNPLSCIQGYTGLLMAKELPQDERAKLLQRILSCSRFMEQIIEDILDAEALERGEIELRKGQVRLQELLLKSLDLMEHTAQTRKVSLSLDAAGITEAALGDSSRLQQVIQNLVSNAIKHVPEHSGKVEVKLRIHGSELLVSVIDNGEGIAGEDLERIFDKFVQADEQHSRGSLGLGLFIARRIVELHGGKLWAESDGKGRGATFSFSLPLYQPEAAYRDYKSLRRMATPPPRRIPAGRSDGPLPPPVPRATASPFFFVKLAAAGAMVLALQAAVWRWAPARAGSPVAALSASIEPLGVLRDAPNSDCGRVTPK